MSKFNSRGLTPTSDAKARKVTDKRGGAIEPRDARARVTTAGRTQKDENVRAIQGVPTGITPVGTRGKTSGDPKSNTIPSKLRSQNKVWRKSGDSRTKSNPLKGA